MIRHYFFILIASALTLGACASPTVRQCTIHSDCPKGNYCMSGLCRYDCRFDFDCKVGRCDVAIGQCTTSDAGTFADLAPPRDLKGVEAGAPDLGVVEDLATTPANDLSTPPDLTIPPKMNYGDICAADGECKTNVCSRNPFSQLDRYCTGPCGSGCMIGDFCVAQLGLCAQNDIGRSCTVAADCRAGACVGATNEPAVCTRLCSTAADCPAGYTCSLAAPNTRACIKVDATQPCAGDSQCWYGTRCDVARGRCLGECTSSLHCPLDHSCVVIGGRTMCAPDVSVGGGGINAPCTTPHNCRSGACLAGRCLTACGVTANIGQYCPGGYGCNPIDAGGGQFILGCLAAGQGAVGSPCGTNTDCTSGLCITDNAGQSYCTRFCNAATCPSQLPTCELLGVVADGVALRACVK